MFRFRREYYRYFRSEKSGSWKGSWPSYVNN